MSMQMLAEGEYQETLPDVSGISLLFARCTRPDLAAIDRILAAPDMPGPGTIITHRPLESDGWVELLASGLTFELHGLAPAQSASVTEPAYRFGLSETPVPTELEAVALVPGPHIAGGGGMIPVVRTITGLAANLALLLPVVAVCWDPARSWMEPGYFTRVIVSWLAGGPFPALGLTALDRQAGGAVESVGLAFFAGQEVRVEAGNGEAPAETAKLAVRVIDLIARQGPIEQFTRIDSPTGEVIVAEPSPDLRLVRVWRGR